MGGGSEDERRAAAIVANSLGATYIHRDHGKTGGRADHDFDLRFPIGRTDEPLEVTTAAVEGAIATRKALSRSSTREAPGLGEVWSVAPLMSVPGGVDARKRRPRTKQFPIDAMHPTVVELLCLLEEAGVDRFPIGKWWELSDRPREAHHRLCRILWVGSSRPCRRGERPHVDYVASYGGAGDADLLRTAIMTVACEPDNVGKLSGDAAERHLFVHIDQTSGDAHVAARNDALPSLPDLPTEITCLWIWADEQRVFKFTRTDGWVEYPVPFEVLMSPEQLCAHS